MPIRIRFPCSGRSRFGSGLASRQCQSSCGSYTMFTHAWKSEFFKNFYSQHCHDYTVFYLSHKCQMCQIFLVFWTAQKSTLSTRSFAWNWYRSGSAGSGSACTGCRFRSRSSKIMWIRPDTDPDPDQQLTILYINNTTKWSNHTPPLQSVKCYGTYSKWKIGETCDYPYLVESNSKTWSRV